jgi:hypothetical protein
MPILEQTGAGVFQWISGGDGPGEASLHVANFFVVFSEMSWKTLIICVPGYSRAAFTREVKGRQDRKPESEPCVN